MDKEEKKLIRTVQAVLYRQTDRQRKEQVGKLKEGQEVELKRTRQYLKKRNNEGNNIFELDRNRKSKKTFHEQIRFNYIRVCKHFM